MALPTFEELWEQTVQHLRQNAARIGVSANSIEKGFIYRNLESGELSITSGGQKPFILVFFAPNSKLRAESGVTGECVAEIGIYAIAEEEADPIATYTNLINLQSRIAKALHLEFGRYTAHPEATENAKASSTSASGVTVFTADYADVSLLPI